MATRRRAKRNPGTAGGAGDTESSETGTRQQSALATLSEKSHEPQPRPPDYDVPGPENLSRALADKLIEARGRMPRRYAATSNGVSPKTLERWLQIGASCTHDPICIYLACRFHQTEAEDVAQSITYLQVLRAVNPAASDLYLKIMHPEDFGGHVRETVDEFEGRERNARAQDNLLASPPPRMLAKMRQYRWVQIPEGATAEEAGEIEEMISAIQTRLANERAGTFESQESES
jgi:hypothetical protein